jgi:molybdopterin molybdotransferase
LPEPETPLAERPWEDVERMVTVDQALERVLGSVSPLPAVDRPLLDAAGMVLAADVHATTDIPPFRNSAIDGYGLRSGVN